jgi:cyclophilin family peptidyl-prolyl cis-trans isomerase
MRRITILLLLALILAACGGSNADDTAPAPDTEDVPAATEPVDGGGTQGDSGALGDDPDPALPPGDSGPDVGEHWHAAYGIFICDSFADPIADESDPEGLHTHADGVIHIHPFFPSAANENATMGKFFEAVGITLSDEGFFSDAGSLEEGRECADGPAEFKVARWSLSGLQGDPDIVDTGIADIRFVEDLEVFTLALVSAGTELTPPPWVGNLARISDVDPSELPELPPGFAVASVEPPAEGEAISGETPCPAVDGSSPRVTTFASAPPTCTDPTATYTATFVTNYGDVVVELDTGATPDTVNNFVVLARYHYYDDTALFRTAPSIAIIQGGGPHTNSPADSGPGYTIDDEADGFTYSPGDLAMARTAKPDSSSAQFFFSAGAATENLNGEPGNPDGSGRGTYVVFGRTVEGLDVLEEILSFHVEDARLAGGGPGLEVVVTEILITED